MSDKVNIVFRTADGERLPVAAPIGASLMQAAVMNNVPGIEAECGGSCVCATCHVYCDEADPQAIGDISDQESEMLETAAAERRASSRLSCQIKVNPGLEGAVIEVPEVQY